MSGRRTSKRANKARHALGWLLLTVAVFSGVGSPASASPQRSYPGGIAELRLPKSSANLPLVKFGLREPVIIDAGDHWRILVGIELDTLPGEYLLYIKPAATDSEASTAKFTVQQRLFPLQNTTPERPLKIVHKHFSELDFSNSNQPELPLQLPVNWPDQWSRNFGHISGLEELQQEVDDFDDASEADESLKQQNYISLTTTALAPVIAPQNAIISRVIQSDEGLATVFLDHGRGVYSVISGVANLNVELGNGVVAGAVIGKSPQQSDIATPHTLYWQTVINGVYVDPWLLADNEEPQN